MNEFQDTMTAHDDPLYKEGMKHLQAGEWASAIDRFEQLQATYPEDAAVEKHLEEARFKAEFDAGTRARPKRWIIPWRQVLVGVIFVALITSLAMLVGRFIEQQVLPMIAEAQEVQRLERMLNEANAYLEAAELAAAEERYQQILETDPNHQEAQEGLVQIEEEREIIALYERGVRLEEEDNDEAALAVYEDLLKRRPLYRDVERRVEQINARNSIEALFAAAEEDYENRRWEEAVPKYEEVRERNVNYQKDMVEERLFEIYMDLGAEIVEHNPPALDEMPTALNYFTKALALQPQSQQAKREQQMAKLFIDGQVAYYQNDWEEAINRLQIVYDQDQEYLGDTILNMLYDAYVRQGDEEHESGDVYLAYEHYRRAMELPVKDTAWAQGRMFRIKPQLTPTPTPLPTPTPRPEGAQAGATPRPLTSYRNKIVFLSDVQYPGELWIMDPDGENRERLGSSWTLRQQYEDLKEQERYSPDGTQFAFEQSMPHSIEEEVEIFITLRPEERQASNWNMRITDFQSISYDPVWSPVGDRIAFVSQVPESDNIWIVNTDGSDAQPLTDNEWEWDKHPSWSPDGKQIVFWSNRTGVLQIFVMDVDEVNKRDYDREKVVNISNTEWDEYDPIWLK